MAPIFTDSLRLEPEDAGVDRYHASLGASLGAAAGEAFSDMPVKQLLGIGELENAKGDLARFGATGDDYTPTPSPSMVPIGDARSRVKDAGLDKDLKLGDQDIAEPALNIMMDRARERRERQSTMDRGPQGFMADALSVGTSFLVGAVDPINIASAFIPVMGEARYAKLLANAGESLASRSAVRAGVGAAQGGIGQAALEPLDWWSHTQDGRDFGMADVLHNILFGTVLGGALHAGGGAVGDTWRRRQGEAVYPFGAGEPLENAQSTPVTSPALVPDTTMPSPAVHVIDDLPMRAKEDISRAGIAALIEGEPLRIGEMLEVAAKSDPRIAEAFSPEHIRGATIKHDGQIYEGINHADALGKLEDRLGYQLDDISDEALSAGFATTKGRIVSREEALSIASKVDQVKPGQYERADGEAPASGLIAEHTKMAQTSNPKIVLGADVPAGPKPRGRAAAHPDTWSLNEHLANNGGLAPHPELKAIYGSDRGPFLPGFGPLIRKGGMSLDDALTTAKEHGYIGEASDQLGPQANTMGSAGRRDHGMTSNDLLDRLDAENRGQKQYKPGHAEQSKYDPEQEKHVIMGHLENEIEASGGKVSDIDPKLLDRTVEIVHRDGVSDVLVAYERAIMEDAERYEGLSHARRNTQSLANLPGWDAADGPAAPRHGTAGDGPGRPAGFPDETTGRGNGPEPRNDGGGDRGPGSDPVDRDAAWRDLSQQRPEFDDADIVAASKAADDVPRPPSKLDERVSASEKADAFARQMYDMFKDRMAPEDRQRLDDVLKTIENDNEARQTAIVRAGSCLFGVI